MQSLQWLRHVAFLLDSKFRIPGTRIRFGFDPILSLIPGVGDLASPAYAVALLVQGAFQGVPKVVLFRMLLNALVDALIGAVPVAGSIGDIFWRANTRNLALLERHARPGVPPSRSDRLFVLAAAAVFGLIIMVPVSIGLWLTVRVWMLLAL